MILLALIGCNGNVTTKIENIELGTCSECVVGTAGWANKIGMKSAKQNWPSQFLLSIQVGDVDYQYFTGNIVGTNSSWYATYMVSGEEVILSTIDQNGNVDETEVAWDNTDTELIISDWSIDSDIMSFVRDVSPIGISPMSDYRFSDSLAENNTSVVWTSYPFGDLDAGAGGWPCFYDATSAVLIVFNDKIPDCPPDTGCSDEYNQSYWDNQYRVPYLLNCPSSMPLPDLMPEVPETSTGNH